MTIAYRRLRRMNSRIRRRRRNPEYRPLDYVAFIGSITGQRRSFRQAGGILRVLRPDPTRASRCRLDGNIEDTDALVSCDIRGRRRNAIAATAAPSRRLCNALS